MDFVKKNWGLLAFCSVCLTAALGVLTLWIGAMGRVSESRKGFEESVTFYESVKAFGTRLSDENRQVAEGNKERARRRFSKMRAQLANKSRVERTPPTSPILCLRTLREDIRAMHRLMEWSPEQLEKRTDLSAVGGTGTGMEGDTGGGAGMGDAGGGVSALNKSRLASNCSFLSFDRIARTRRPPKRSQVPEIFRQLSIIKEVVRLLSASKVEKVLAIDRPMGLENIQEDKFLSTPLHLRIVGKAEDVQGLINSFYSDAKYVFFLRKITLQTEDQVQSDGKLSGNMESGMGGAGMGGPGMGGADMGMAMGGAGMGMMDNAGAEVETSNTHDAMGLDLQSITREKFVRFKDRLVTADIRFDLVEFLPPPQEEE